MSIMQRLGLYNNNLGGCERKTFNHFLLVLLGIFPLFFVSAPNKRQQLDSNCLECTHCSRANETLNQGLTETEVTEISSCLFLGEWGLILVYILTLFRLL